jgi:hypothetical protein
MELEIWISHYTPAKGKSDLESFIRESIPTPRSLPKRGNNAAHPHSERQTQIAPELIFDGGSFVPTFLLEPAATMSNPKPHLNPVFAIPYLPGFPLVPTLAN